MKRKIFISMLIILILVPLFSGSVLANQKPSGPNPFQHVDIGGNIDKVKDNEIVKTGNFFLAIVFVVAGIIISILFVVGCVLLATSGASASRRSSGFIALGFALLAGYFLYKAGALDTIFASISG